MATSIDLCTRDEVRLVLSKDVSATGVDSQIDAYIPRASELIMEHTGREFVTTLGTASGATPPVYNGVATRSFRWDGGEVLTFDWRCDLRTLTAITVDEGGAAPITTTLTADDYRFLTLNPRGGVQTQIELRAAAPARSTSATHYTPSSVVRITGTWGFAAVPGDVKQAAADTVAHWVRQMGFGGSLADDMGVTSPGRTWALPGAAKDILDAWKRRTA